MFRYGMTALFVAAQVGCLIGSEKAPSRLGAPVPEFSLKDFRGKNHSLSEYNSSPVVVLAVVGTECPLAKQYAVKLQKMADAYSDRGVTVLAIDANRQDALSEIAAFAKSNSLTFPILKDLNQEVVNGLQATRTPEVFVLDKQRVVRYRGRVDDQYAVGGKFRKSPSREDLKIAIDEVLEGKAVSVPETPSMGCLISRSREPDRNATVTYSNQIARILQKNCVECHRPGEIAPFSLTDYHEVAGWADMIVEVTQSHQMPPWHASPESGHFANERRLTPDELSQLKQWAAAGAPEGNPTMLSGCRRIRFPSQPRVSSVTSTFPLTPA